MDVASEEPREILSRIAGTIPHFPFKGVDRFYDISGLLRSPIEFKECITLFIQRYKAMDIQSIGGLDARGFLFGPPIALALGVPFFMMRKAGKLPNCIIGASYTKEYKGDDAQGEDALAVSRDAISPGDKVLLIDDLIATGGTLLAAISLVRALGGSVVECACVIELSALKGRERIQATYPSVPIFSLIDESLIL